MSYRDILVYLDPSPATVARLNCAVDLAGAHGSRLIGVDASVDEPSAAISEMFWTVAARGQVDGFFVPADRKGSPDYMHCVDLLIAPRPEGEARSLIRADVPDEALRQAGAPMLTIPTEWKPGAIGENIVIAWNASREANRAVHDAMPFLKRAKKVVIFGFSSGESELRASLDLLREHLQRHGVSAMVSDWTNTGDMGAVDALFASLDTQDSDLIVAGAFGHARSLESLFGGGVSAELLRQPTLPMLLSH
jgi:nucleotide-binding universal stress UspA family protein